MLIEGKFIKKINKKSQSNKSSRINPSQIFQIEEFEHKKVQNNINISVPGNQLRNFKMLGIFDRKILVTYHNSLGIYGLIDQHALHQRIRYEFYCQKLFQNCKTDHKSSRIWQKSSIQKVSAKLMDVLGRKINIALKCQDKGLLGSYWGINISNIHGEVYITEYHEIMGHQLSVDQLQSAYKDIIINRKSIPHTIDQHIAEVSCKSAYKFNQEVSEQFCHSLLWNASLCDFPWHCVHGRPTVYFTS